NLSIFNHLRANANDLQCRIQVLRVDSAAAEGIDYGMVDFVGVHLKPWIYATSVADHEDYAMLFTHNALRGSIKHLVYWFGDLPALDCIIPELFGIEVVKNIAMSTRADPRPWIRKFAENFETAERGTDVFRLVTLLHKRSGETAPLRHTVDPLGKPRRTDVPTPRSTVFKQWSERAQVVDGVITTESPTANLFVFENAKSAQKLAVIAWSIEETKNAAQISLHYAFLLMVLISE
ncbi:hypothetical protein AAVH_33221, partial [Aphelenchoides avenae]